MCPRSLEHGQRPEHVHVRVERRLRDGDAHGRLRGEVEHELRPHGVEDGDGISDVPDVQLGAGRDVFRPPGGQVVQDMHLVPARNQRPGDVGADETRAPGHDRPHRAVS